MREKLAYTVKINKIEAIQGADKVEMAYVHNWGVMVRKGEFNVGDLVAYFEIDSKLDKDNPAFAFMENYNFKVKSRKFLKGTVISQGLILALKDLNIKETQEDIDLTKKLKITNIEAEKEKAHLGFERKVRIITAFPIFAKNKLMKKIMFESGGISEKLQKIVDKLAKFSKELKHNGEFPSCYLGIDKTDENRCENLDWEELKKRNLTYRVSTKIDGTSATYIYDRLKKKFIVCSRNMVQPDAVKFDPKYFGSNVYWEMALKHNIEKLLKDVCDKLQCDYACMQGEVYGKDVQDNRHKIDELRFAMFNFIYGGENVEDRYKRIDIQKFDKTEEKYIPEFMLDIKREIECVPTVDMEYRLPESFEEFKKSAEGETEVRGGSNQREGYVYKAWDDKGKLVISFKNINNKYLLDNNL